jgi:hypothetical protein
MANSTSTKVLYFDTAASITGPYQIIGIFWLADEATNKDIAADDDVLITQANGERIIGQRAEFTGDSLKVTPCRPLCVEGITVSALDGGVVYIWLA